MSTHLKDDNYRDHISTVDTEGKRIWVYAKKPKGKFTNYRTWVAWGVLGFGTDLGHERGGEGHRHQWNHHDLHSPPERQPTHRRDRQLL